ncbi:alpha/beta fold hydrolase [uncultured Pseudokineococcus sp.]|uniref:alpha/beta fold hydrolase n=1 Tax=uncultured Pseudokineococcus sp. TaxID=1642928 RepID=UPI00263733CD|nr:alpha/beta hydrolase [uncultured Pseudokineococcus sp.]
MSAPGGGPADLSDGVRPGAPFGGLPLPDGVEPLVLEVAVGRLTALRARPRDEDGRPAPARGTAVLVPGFTGSKEDFLALLPLLAARGWDAWAYSQRGQADSARSPDDAGAGRGTGYLLADLAADAVEVVRLVGGARPPRGAGRPLPGVHLLGHSFGGVVARAAALAAPELLADLVLLCSGPHGWLGRKADLPPRLAAAGGRSLWALDNPGLAERDPRDLEPLDAFLRERSERTSTAALLGAVAVLADTADPTEELAGTGLPVLVAHGEDDDAWPQAWQRAMTARLGARHEVVAGAGHLPNAENPGATAALLDDFWGAGTP